MGRVIGYIRVSTSRQAVFGTSLAAQEDRIRSYCVATGLGDPEIVVDRGASAKNLRRAGMVEALDSVKRGEVAAFVVFKLDRASRSVPDLYSLIALFSKNGVEFHSVTDSINTATAAGRMFVGILAVLAQFERELIGERVSEVVRLKKSRGERVGRVPFGMQVGSDGKHLEPAPAEVEARERARALRASGLSLRAVTARLNEDGASCRGTRWHLTCVARLCGSAVRRAAA